MRTVPLRSKRRERAQALQKFQHAIPAVPLLLAGLQAMRSGERGFAFALGVFEIGTSVLLLVTMVREIRAMRRPAIQAARAHHAVDWIEIFAAGVLTAEVLEHWHLTHHIRASGTFRNRRLQPDHAGIRDSFAAFLERRR